MKLQELRTFLAIVEAGSLVRASSALHVTQSTITARLKSLEAEVGQTLIHRNKSGVTLTAAGMRFLRYADTICDLWRQARKETALPDGMSGVCNMACEYDLWPNLGDRFFEAMQAQHPNIAMSVWLGGAADVAHWLDEGKSDLAFTYRPAVSQRQGQLELPADDLVLLSSEPNAPIRFNPGYVFVEAGDAFGRDHAAAYADADIARISFGNAALGLAYLSKSGGSAYLPRRLAEDQIKSGDLFLLSEAPVFSRSVFLTWNIVARDTWDWLDPLLASGLFAKSAR